MSVTHIVGVDPGLVHTGVVSLLFLNTIQKVHVQHLVVDGLDPSPIESWARGLSFQPDVYQEFIEGYRPRSHFRQDQRMVEGVANIHKALPGSKVLNNTGIKKVVKRPLLELLQCWSWPVSTHHDDLRSAARIAVLGMLKDKDLNRVLSDFALAHLEGKDWTVSAR